MCCEKIYCGDFKYFYINDIYTKISICYKSTMYKIRE